MNTFKKYREKAKLSQAELAQKLGIAASTVAMWECGTNLPQARKLIELSRIYNITIDELLSEDNNA